MSRISTISALLCFSFQITRSLPTNSTPYSPSLYYSNPERSTYNWKRSYPQSCECAESGVGISSCDIFKCNCVCDITAGKCDYNCCCDPDCTSDQIDRFKSLGNCAYEGHAPNYIEYCYDSSELYAVNPRSPMGGNPTAREAVGRALCVEKTNYAFKTDFYIDIGVQGSQIFNQDGGQKDNNYVDNNQIETNTKAEDKYFDQNDTIAAFWNNSRSDGLVSAGLGFLQLPVADNSGQCNDWNFATFENNIYNSENTCIRTLSVIPNNGNNLFQQQCNFQQSVSRYVTDLWIAKSASIVAATGAIKTSDVVKVQLGSIVYRDPSSGTLYDILSQWESNGCGTIALSNSSFSKSNKCYFGSSNIQSVESTVLYLCMNAIESVSYQVNHTATGTGSILAVTADVIVSDVALIVDAANVDETSSIGFKQSFGVQFQSVDAAELSTANGNLVRRRRSGNPGYIMGLPVLFGVTNATSGAVNELVSGMTLPVATSSGTCPTSFDDIVNNALSFGYDSIAGCLVSLSRQELKDFCCTGASGSCLDNAQSTELNASPYINEATGIPFFLNVTDGLIGMYGDADPLDKDQWLQLSISFPTDTRQWNDKTSTCTNVFSGMNVQFLVSYTGERANPQNKIVSALAEVVTSDWTFGVPVADHSNKQNFQLSVVTSYVFKNLADFDGYQPPAPPVLFTVPYDVFYPFLTSGSSSRIQWSIASILGIIMCSSMILMVNM